MLPAVPLQSAAAEKPNDFETAVDFVRSVALAYKNDPLAELTDSVVLSDGATLRASFAHSYDNRLGSCFMADGELPVEGDVKRLFSDRRREICFNLLGAKQMIKIWLEPAPENSAVRAVRDRVTALR